MLVMRTTEDPTDPLGELVSAEQSVGLDHFALAVYPFGFYGVKPRALFRQQAAHDPRSGFAPALFDSAVMFSQPAPEFLGDVPAGVVPDEQQDFLAESFELFAAPREELRRYAAHGPTINEAQPCLVELRKIEPVAGDSLRSFARVVLGDRPLEEAQRLSLLGPAAQGRQSHPAPPTLVLKAGSPLGICSSHLHQSVASEASLFFFRTGDRESLSIAWPSATSLREGVRASPGSSHPRPAFG